MKPVRKLPSEVCSLVRSGVVIPTPSQAVVELVLNSIDAGATSVAIRVDLRIFKIQVVDNGYGITSKDLEQIGKRSVTSKCYNLDEFYNNLENHGYRGEFLASLREMCGLLEIVTRPSDSNTTYSKLFVHGGEEEVKVSDLKRPTHGTTVTVTDFMFNMPVRRERMKDAVELEAMRSCIECIALAHPEISLSIRNDVKGRIIMEKHKSSDLLNAFEHLFGHNLARMLAPVNFSTEKFKINGYIGKEAYRHNDLQFIYVNRQPILKTKLHKLVAALISKSSIIRTNGPWKNKPIPKDVPVERWLSFSSLEKQKKFAVFVINITCARKEYEMCWDTKKPLIYFKDWEGITACVSNTIQEFLKLENLIEDDDVENAMTGDETGKSISAPRGAQPSHTSVPWKNPEVNFDVETWNIQGAVHGICAKRPKERNMKHSSACEESEDPKPDSLNQIRRQFLTPDTINSSKEGLQGEPQSVPPVVEFLQKYEIPSAARLQITSGAYRLKQKEEEEKKLKIAKKLGTFKFSGRSKLPSSKNVNDQSLKTNKLTCEKSLIKEKTKDQPFLKTKIKDHKRKVNSRVSEPYNSNLPDALSLKTGRDKLCSDSEHHDRINMNVSQQKCQIFMDSDSSVLESEDISNYFSLSPSSCNMKTKTTLCGTHTFSFTKEQTSSNENENSKGIMLWNSAKRSLSHASNNETNNQVHDSFHRSFMKSVNSSKFPSYFNKKHANASSINDNFFVWKHDGSNSSSFGLNETYGVKKRIMSCDAENTKKCANLGVSKMLVVSIPTPQSKGVAVQTVTSSVLKGESHCSNICSKRNKEFLADSCDNNICSYKPTVPFVNDHNSLCHDGRHKSNLFEELFGREEDNFCATKHNGSEKNTLKFISSSLVKSNMDESSNPPTYSNNISNDKVTCAPHVVYENAIKDVLFRDKVYENIKTVKPTKVSSFKKINFRNIFESFEKPPTPSNSIESRSPYFTFKNNSINCREIMKSHDFDWEAIKNKSNGSNFRPHFYKNKEDGHLLSVFDVSEPNEQVELFPDLDKSNKNTDKEIDVCPSVNFSLSEFSSVIDRMSCSRELDNATCIDISMTSPHTVSNVEYSSLTHGSEHKENFSDAKDVPRKKTLLQNTVEMVSTGKKELFSAKEKAEEVAKEVRSYDSNNYVTLECDNMGMCDQAVSIPPSEEQCKKKTENSLDEVVDKDWFPMRNFEGKMFYFHAPSGFTTYNEPIIAKDASLYSMSKRCQVLPKGMSPLLATSTALSSVSEQQAETKILEDTSDLIRSSSDQNDLKTVKWRNKPDIFNNDISDVLSIAKALPNKETLASNTTISDMSYMSSKLTSLLLQQKFDKRIFSNIQVVGQLDNKFIITLCSLDKISNPHIIGIFDQHAVHERIRLETLMKAYSSNQDEWSFTATDLDEPIVLTVSSKESHIMSSFQNKFQKLGLYFTLVDKDNVKICRIPTCLYTRSLRERSCKWLEGILHVLIQDVVLFLIKTGGQDAVVPEVFKDVINSEACKGAIKFGDSLSVVQCEGLLSELSKCDLPFYCAHGRPSFMPVFDLRQFEEERKKCIQGY